MKMTDELKYNSESNKTLEANNSECNRGYENIRNDFNKTEEIDYDNAQVNLHPLLERFLDASSYEDKLDIFYLMRGAVDVKVLRDVAMSLDIEATKDDVDELYADILYCLKTMERFECNRLRRI